MCWGGGQLFTLSAEVHTCARVTQPVASLSHCEHYLQKVINVVASAHPSIRLTKADAEKLSGPVCFLPAGDDPEWKDMEQYVCLSVSVCLSPYFNYFLMNAESQYRLGTLQRRAPSQSRTSMSYVSSGQFPSLIHCSASQT